MLAIQVRARHGCDKKLAAVRVWPSICHGQQKWSGMFEIQSRLFVVEFAAVDTGSSGAIAFGYVAALNHEAGDYAMESTAFVSQSRSIICDESQTKRPKICCSLGGIRVKQPEYYPLGCAEKKLSKAAHAQ